MAKKRESSEPDTHTKKLRQALKAKSGAAARRTDGGVEAPEKEEKLERKVKSNPRLVSHHTKGNVPSFKSSNSRSTIKASKYFQSAAKEDEESEEDFDMATSPLPRLVLLKKQENEEDDSEEDEDNWEEVEELAEPLGPTEPSELVLPSESLEIEIETPEVRRRKKKKAEFETYLRRMINRVKKDLHTDTHKVHLMCLIASGMYRNRLCTEPDLLAVTMSLLPAHFGAVSKERMDQNYLLGLLKWFRATFTLNPCLPTEERPDPRALLERRLSSLSARNHQEMTHLFLLVLRSLQLYCRLVLSLQPIPLKQPSAKGKGARTSIQSSKETSKTNSPELKVSLGTKRAAGGGKVKGETGGKKARRNEKNKKDEVEEGKPASKGGQTPKNLTRRSVASKVSYKEESNSEEGEEEVCERLSDEEFEAVSNEDSEDSEEKDTSIKGKSKPNKRSNSTAASKRSSGAAGKQRKMEAKSKGVKEEDQEEEEEEMTSSGTKRRGGKRKEGPGADEWLEVYLQKSSSWVCVDVEHGVGIPQHCSQNATAPITYVVSVDEEGFVKDLGRKYDPTWMTTSRKRRVEDNWWEETLGPLLGPEDEKDIKEEKELQNKLLNKPLPISIAEYKNHPLYALKRHLLKYEAIYPPTAAMLGYCRREPVYSRDCVHTLHSKDTWLKEARTVRLGEEPYKMVKGFSNRSRKARIMSEQKEEKDLPLFGEWQTEEYQPPIAVDGKVPRNDYGNVYLFKPCMLPVGCIHLRLPNLHRVAKKLNMDAAPAVTGFDFHGGYSHAVSDGYIVCEEHEEILRAAWVEDQEHQKQKEKEKKEKRAISNWTLLVKGLLIRERLKRRYSKKNQGLASTAEVDDAGNGFSSDEEPAESGSSGGKTASETLALSWPQNRQTEEDNAGVGVRKSKREKKGQQQHLFPFEKV